MQLVAVSVETIRIGHPLPFPLMDKAGVLLAKKSFVIESLQDLIDISQRGGGLYIDVADSQAHHRAYMERLHGLVRDGKSLGVIADAKLEGGPTSERAPLQEETRADWLDLQVQGNSLLRDTPPRQFLERLDRLHGQLELHTRRNPDGALFALIYLSATDSNMYSASHAMLVSVMCALAAREVLGWPAPVQDSLCKAALTMNLGMTEVQDRLARQVEAPNARQRTVIDGHADRSANMLAACGVKDALWLQAVREHHTQGPGPLASKTSGERLARLIQRADMFSARLAPRAARMPVPPATAMQACYFDETRKVDEAGGALIKAVGIYQPGTFVRLATDEVAIVVQRGMNTTTPRVAVLINRSGMPTIEPTVRETSQRDYKIVASVAHRDVKVTVNLERLLPLTVSVSSDRPW
jgi:HD-GYP domain-containing protein (c-di-GMP phosphodiesterase class II)